MIRHIIPSTLAALTLNCSFAIEVLEPEVLAMVAETASPHPDSDVFPGMENSSWHPQMFYWPSIDDDGSICFVAEGAMRPGNEGAFFCAIVKLLVWQCVNTQHVVFNL